MNYKEYYDQLKALRNDIITTRDKVKTLQEQWSQHSPISINIEDVLGDDLYKAYRLINQALQVIPTFDWSLDSDGNLKAVDGAAMFERYATNVKGAQATKEVGA